MSGIPNNWQDRRWTGSTFFRIFTRVVDAAGFTRAADTLGLPRSSVSAAVAELEGRVGARLLNRTTHKVAPTQDGAAFYERCLRVIADVEETEGLFRQTAQPSGRLRVDVPGRIGRLILAPALPSFLEAYPEIDIELGVTDRAVDLVGEGVDCVLRVGPLGDSGLIARTIGTLPLINVASPDYLARHGSPENAGRSWPPLGGELRFALNGPGRAVGVGRPGRAARDPHARPRDGQQRRSLYRLLPGGARTHPDPGL